ncbi:hypothetical protein AAC387_Pa10g1160 [Persea americana]
MTRLSEDHGNPPTLHLGLGNQSQQLGGSIRNVSSEALQFGSSVKECPLSVSTQQLGSSVRSASSTRAAQQLCSECQLGSSACVLAEKQLSQTVLGPGKSTKAKSGPSHLPKVRASPDR